jgi:hypothetical protein
MLADDKGVVRVRLCVIGEGPYDASKELEWFGRGECGSWAIRRPEGSGKLMKPWPRCDRQKAHRIAAKELGTSFIMVWRLCELAKAFTRSVAGFRNRRRSLSFPLTPQARSQPLKRFVPRAAWLLGSPAAVFIFKQYLWV